MWKVLASIVVTYLKINLLNLLFPLLFTSQPNPQRIGQREKKREKESMEKGGPILSFFFLLFPFLPSDRFWNWNSTWSHAPRFPISILHPEAETHYKIRRGRLCKMLAVTLKTSPANYGSCPVSSSPPVHLTIFRNGNRLLWTDDHHHAPTIAKKMGRDVHLLNDQSRPHQTPRNASDRLVSFRFLVIRKCAWVPWRRL
jgi:hypothetical protein